MIDYFKQILEETYETFGARQCENMDDEQYTRLLDKLVYVSSLYPYIPEEEQKKIINKRLVTDKEYRNINARLISGWLEQDGKIFHKEIAHTETELPEDYKPLEGEAREAMLTMWQNALRGMNETFTQALKPTGSGSRLRENLESLAHEPSKEIPKEEPKHFCVMPKRCDSQCTRCKDESEILNQTI